MANYDDISIRLKDLEINPTPRIPVCLCLDISGSMEGEPIEELNSGIKSFYDAIRDDEDALYSVEMCIVTYGGTYECVEDFASVERQMNVPVLKANGGTPMGEAVNLALSLMEQRKNEYKQKGVDYYQPWLVLMTDGKPNGSPSELEKAIKAINELIKERKLTVFPVAIGNDADLDVLRRFSPNRMPLRLKGLNFREFFAWVSSSVSRVSASLPGEKIQLDLEKIKDWADL